MSRRRFASRQYSSEANAFFSRLSTKPTPQRAAAYQYLIGSLVGAGIWTKLDALWVLAAADEATALTNLVSSSYTLTKVSTPTFAANVGYTGNGSSTALSTGYNPGAGGTLYSQNDASIFGWSQTAGNTGVYNTNNSMMGVATTDANIFPRDSSNVLRARLHSGSSVSMTVASGQGLLVNCRTGASAQQAYAYTNAAFSQSNTGTAASSTPKNATMRLLGTDLGFWAGQMSAAGAGRALTRAESDVLHAALRQYLWHTGAI